MKAKWMFLFFAVAVAACTADATFQPKGGVAQQADVAKSATITQGDTQDEVHTAMDTAIPENFSAYATSSVEEDKRCVAGASTDEDGLNQKPVLSIVSGPGEGSVQWSQTLPLPPDTYQGRATHCLGADGSLYVLIQSDTQPEQTLSQTLLQVLKIDLGNGALRARADVGPADVTDAYSAWLEEGAENFQLQNGKLVMSGKYYRLVDAEDRKPFQVELDSDLKR